MSEALIQTFYILNTKGDVKDVPAEIIWVEVLNGTCKHEGAVAAITAPFWFFKDQNTFPNKKKIPTTCTDMTYSSHFQEYHLCHYFLIDN